MECPANQYFNAKTSACDAREKVPCGIAPPRQSRLDDILMVCPPRGEYSYPHPESCNHYFMCINGVSALLDCGQALRFDIASQQCALPEKSICLQKTVK